MLQKGNKGSSASDQLHCNLGTNNSTLFRVKKKQVPKNWILNSFEAFAPILSSIWSSLSPVQGQWTCLWETQFCLPNYSLVLIDQTFTMLRSLNFFQIPGIIINTELLRKQSFYIQNMSAVFNFLSTSLFNIITSYFTYHIASNKFSSLLKAEWYSALHNFMIHFSTNRNSELVSLFWLSMNQGCDLSLAKGLLFIWIHAKGGHFHTRDISFLHDIIFLCFLLFYMYSFNFMQFPLPPVLPLPPSPHIPFTPLPPSIPFLFLMRKGQAFHGCQQSMVYQAEVVLSSSSHIKAW